MSAGWWTRGRTHLVLGELLLQRGLHVARGLEVAPERLLDDDARRTVLDVVVALEVLGDRDEYARGQGHVEDAVRLLFVRVAGLDLDEHFLEVNERGVRVVLARHVRAQREELLELGLELGRGRLDMLGHSLVVLLR